MVRSLATARLEGATGLLEALRFALDDARLAAAISGVGPTARPYSGQPFGRITDLARHAARMRVEWWIQWVEPDSIGVAGELAGSLLTLRPESKFLWWGPGIGGTVSPGLINGNIHIASTDSPRGVLRWMCSEGLLPAGMFTEELPSPYLTGMLTPADGLRLGLAADQPIDGLAQEMEWLHHHGLDARSLIRLDVSRVDDAAALSEILSFLSRSAVPFSFALTGFSGDTNPDTVQQLLSARVKRVAFTHLMPAEKVSSLTEAGVETIIPDPRHELEARKTSGVNGTVAMFSGLYPDLDQGVGVTHFGLGPATGEERLAARRWVGPNLRLRSAGVLTLETQEFTTMPDSHASDVKQQLGGWPSHLYELVTMPDGTGVVRYDGSDQAALPIRFLPYAARGEAETKALTVLSVRTQPDVESLESDLRRFHSSGVVQTYHPSRQVIVENTCRWRRWGSCSLLSMRRLSVDNDGQLSACGDAGMVGAVGEVFDQIVARQKQAIQMAEIQRGCSTCLVRDECSHCIHLPEAWAGRYCEIRRAYPQASLFFELAAFPHLIGKFLVDNDQPVTMEVSAPGLPWRYGMWATGTRRQGHRPVIVSVSDLHFAWNRWTTKITRLSGPLAVLLEGWWAGSPAEELQVVLQTKFGVSEDTAATGVRDGLPLLQAGGLCHG